MATMTKTLSSLFCFLSLSLLLSTNQATSQSDHMATICNPFSDNFTETSLYQSNREMLLSLLEANSFITTYANATVVGLNSDTIYGMFFCRGDISNTSCWRCVRTATQEIAKNCTHQKEAFIFYEGCMVRYSNIPFLTLVEERPYIVRYSQGSAPNSATFGQTLSDKMDELIVKASSSLSYFVEDEERVTQLEGSYDLDSMVQCSPDLDSRNCTVCLKHAVQEILDCCSNSLWAQLFLPKCLLRFEATALSSPPPSSPPPPPPMLLPSPPLFTRPEIVPNVSGSFSTNVLKGAKIFLRILIPVVTVYMFSLLGL